MKAIQKIFAAILLFLPFSLNAAEFRMITIKQAEDLQEEFCRVWKKGDFLISDGDNLALIGGTPRSLKTSLTYFPIIENSRLANSK